MNETNTSAVLQKILTNSVEIITPMLKAIGHQKRYQILILLLKEPKSFGYLLKELKIGKTALANHLTYLLEALLVIKLHQGIYALSEDAIMLLEILGEIYQKSRMREHQKQRSLQAQYTRGYTRLRNIKRKIITPEPKFVKTEISYLGAFLGTLNSIGSNVDLVTLGGYSGYSFIINVAKNRLCPSGSIAFSEEVWKSIWKGTEVISGWKLKIIGDKEPYPTTHPIDEVDKNRALKLFNKIKEDLEKNNRPILLWGIPLPEYGIVFGYEDEHYICSTYRESMGLRETPIYYYDLQAPGRLHAILLSKKIGENLQKIDFEAIKRAHKLLTNSKTEIGYVIGVDAIREWARVLENESIDNTSYHGNCRMGKIIEEASKISHAFLNRMAIKYQGTKQVDYLQTSAREYQKINLIFSKFNKLFPCKIEGNLEQKNRIQGAEFLKKIIPHLQYISDSLERVIEVWE